MLVAAGGNSPYLVVGSPTRAREELGGVLWHDKPMVACQPL